MTALRVPRMQRAKLLPCKLLRSRTGDNSHKGRRAGISSHREIRVGISRPHRNSNRAGTSNNKGSRAGVNGSISLPLQRSNLSSRDGISHLNSSQAGVNSNSHGLHALEAMIGLCAAVNRSRQEKEGHHRPPFRAYIYSPPCHIWTGLSLPPEAMR